ncbi:hypothetical protein ACP70R_002729 [Stipagrostis hirtigluma subsp. patula]
MEQSSSTATTSSSSPSSSRRGRELQGPRPAPLKVRRDSHRIRKPPPPAQVRQPVIIYTASPKVVHAQPSEFMSVVQRLTGAPASSLPPPRQPSPPLPLYGGGHHHVMMPMPSSSAPAPMQLPFHLHQQQQAGPVSSHELIQLSPAARLAAVQHDQSSAGGSGLGPPPLQSILSPVPGSLPAIPPSFFSPPAAGGINLFGELVSPAFHGAATTGAAGAASPNFPTSTLPSPSAGAYYWDLFNNNHHQNQ